MAGPLPAVANALKVQHLWTTSLGRSLYTGLFFRYSGGPPNTTDATALAVDAHTAMSVANTQWSADVDLAETIVTDLSSTSGALGLHASSVAGGKTPGGLDNGTAVVADYAIARRYRGGKPRSYFPWGVGSDLTSRTAWDPAFVSACQSALGTYFGSVVGSTSGSTTITDHISISYYEGFTVVTSPTTGRARNKPTRRTTPVVDAVLGLTVSGRPGSQRRRN
jgi:hypothetical protein